MNCYKHKNVKAIAQCSSCGRQVCEKCYSKELSICKACRRRLSLKRFFAALIEFVIPAFIGMTLSLNENFWALEFCILTGIYVLIKDGFKGRSLMKRAVGLKVVSIKTGNTCNVKQSMLRNIILFIPFGALVELTMMEYTKDMRRLGDKIAGTKVIESRETESS